MAFMSMIMASLFILFLFIITVIGVLLFITGLIFLIVFLIRRRKKKTKGFLIAAIIMLCVSGPIASILPVLSIVNSASRGSKTITIENTVYRNGFSGDLYPLFYIDYPDDYYNVNGQTFHRVNCERFDLMYTPTNGSAFDALYCSEEQWEQARSYYADGENFIYYCSDKVLPNMNVTKFDELMEFVKENEYNPFGSNSDVKTCRLPMPDRSSELIFYKESKDGILVSSKGNGFYLINGKLLMVFYYDMGHGNYEELVAVEVPEEIGQYFVELLEQEPAAPWNNDKPKGT